MQHVSQALLLKLALKFDFKYAERLYLPNVSRNGVVSPSAVYIAAFSNFSGVEWTTPKNL